LYPLKSTNIVFEVLFKKLRMSIETKIILITLSLCLT
jgi:hypothetical protein